MGNWEATARILENLRRSVEDVRRRVGYLETNAETLPPPSVAAPFLALPGLRGLWTMGAFDGDGNAHDLSGHGHVLTYNGNPTYGYAGFVPYIDFDGVGDYLNRADDADFDIAGTESYVAPGAQGVTLGGWFYIHTMPGARQYLRLMSKGASTGNVRSYALYVDVGRVVFLVSQDGASFSLAQIAITAGAWYWVVGRYIPGTEIAVFCNSQVNRRVTSIPAALYNSAVGFSIGGQADGTNLIQARASMCWLSAMALGNEQIGRPFTLTRGFYGV